MPINEGRIGKIVAEHLQIAEPKILKYLKEITPREPANIVLTRYFGTQGSYHGRTFKGISGKLGKEFYQPVIEAIASDVHGQVIVTGRDKVDAVVKREYYAEWFPRICSDYGLGDPPPQLNAGYRSYQVQVKTDQASASGGTKGDAVGSLLRIVSDVRKEGNLDVVGVFYNVFGTIAESRHSPKFKNLHCYEISGKAGFDWLVGDPDGRLYDVFRRALKETSMNSELRDFLEQNGFFSA